MVDANAPPAAGAEPEVDAETQARRAAATTNTKHYMKSAFISMITVTLATQGVNYFTGREDPVSCELNVNDNSWIGKRYESLRYFNPAQTDYNTQYVPMKDGVDLAVDTYVAEYITKKNQTVPTILYTTRHGRGYTLDFPFSLFASYKKTFTNPRTNIYVQRFVTNGYAWVSVDVRGTGASAGSKKHDFADQEIEDGYEIIEWITKQPWSNGEVAAIGHGMEGVGALLLAASKHPALKAISLNGAPVDLYRSAFYPGGVKNRKALEDYSSFTFDTDRQIRWREIPTLKPRIMMNYFGGNVYPVNDNVAQFKNYIAQHANNPDLREELLDVKFRDDKLKNVGVSFEELDIIRHLADIASSGVAIHSFGGYYDMGVARSSILLYQYLTNTLDADTASLLPKLPEDANTEPFRHRLTLGPWSHAGVDNTDPFATSKQKCFYHLDEISRYFDHHMYPNRHRFSKVEGEEPVHYFTLVHSKWKSSVTWPPAHLSDQTLYFGPDQSIEEVATPSGEVTIDVAHNPLYDVESRWNMISHLFGIRPYYYNDRQPMEDQYATFLTPELPLTEITGEVELRLFFSVDKPNVNLVAYLEDVDYQLPFKNENKRRGVTYITEAVLNPVHSTISKDSSVQSFLKKDSREIKANEVYEAVLRFEPVSYFVKRKHQLRVSIGVATPKEFGNAGEELPTKLTVHFGGEYPTSIKLPTFSGVFTENIVPKLKDEEIEEIAFANEEATAPAAPATEEDEFASTEEKDEL
ncbi:Serine protease family s15, partial [Globisporangium splendens]